MMFLAPTALLASAMTRLHVTISWSAAVTDTLRDVETDELRVTEEGETRLTEMSATVATEYAVYRDGLLVGTTETTYINDGLHFTDTNVVPGVTYQYTVTAWDSGSEEDTSDPSQELEVTIPAQLVYPPVVSADLSAARPRIYEPKENLTARGRE